MKVLGTVLTPCPRLGAPGEMLRLPGGAPGLLTRTLEDAPQAVPVLETPAEGESVSVAPPAAVPYQSPQERGWDTDYPIQQINPDGADRTQPKAVTLSWSWPEESYFTVELSAKEDFSEALILHSETTTVQARNLAPDTLYYWRVTAGGKSRSAVGHFRTEPQLPRWFDIPGASNVRDAGGWPTADGRRVKEGMIFRGTQLDGKHAITPEGRDYMVHALGIKTDLDLRGPSEVGDPNVKTGRPLGDEVEWVNIPVAAYKDVFTEEGQRPAGARSSVPWPSRRPTRSISTAGAAPTEPGHSSCCSKASWA